MDASASNYDDRYLAGIVLFNQRDFFEAHEVWEALWLDRPGDNKRFVQALIQAAVGLLHFTNGNLRGAAKLYRSARKYMEAYGQPHYLGLDVTGFWQQMEKCFAQVLAVEDPDRSIEIDPELIPTIELDPPPAAWPDPAPFLEEDEH